MATIIANATAATAHAQAQEAPAPRCPHCRTVNPTIVYGQYTWNWQRFTPEDRDWSSSTYGEGDMVVGANCHHCDADLTNYLMKFDRKHPDNDLPTHFNHDVFIERALPVDRKRSQNRNPILALRDDDLQQLILSTIKALGQYLDERDERVRLDAWQPKRTS